MIQGNTQAVDILQRYLSKHIDTATTDMPSFFVLSGPAHIGKTTAAKHSIQSILGQHSMTDFLHIQDMSEFTGKKHELKVKTPETTPFIDLPDGNKYQDRGVREITSRLQQSFIGKAKIVLIDNIERMTIAAANAFLKTAEEPLPHRIIIATTSHISQVLDTIASRAITIPFHPLSDQEMLDFMQSHNIFTESNRQNIALSRALGRPGVLRKFHDSLDEQSKNLLQHSIHHLSTMEQGIHPLLLLLQNIHTAGYLHPFIDALISYLIQQNHATQAAKRLKVKRLLRKNIQTDHVLLYGLL